MKKKVYTPEEVEAALLNPDPNKVISWINEDYGIMKKYGIKPTLEQVNRGMIAEYPHVPSRRGSYKGNEWKVADMWVCRQDYPPTDSQVADGLSHPDMDMRYAWASRLDYTPTDDQISAGLKDTWEILSKFWSDRTDIQFNKEHIDILLQNFINQPYNYDKKHDVVKVSIFERSNLTSDQIDRIIDSPYFERSHEVKAFIRTKMAEIAASDIQNNQSSRPKTRL